ncbi:MAG: serine/threonine-protein kinase, partial [Acidobacteriota bacterium]
GVADPQHHLRFFFERQLVDDVGELDGRPYIAMQYVDGVELADVVDELTLEEKAQVMLRVCDAVHHAHQEGLIHRDLKPNNIMVQREPDGRYRPVVVDFGLVYEHLDPGTAVTRAGQVLGTPPYLAPEQVEGRRDRLDRRTDVYGLGATLYELFTGRPLFVAERGVDLLIKTLHEEPKPPRRWVPSLPQDLETIILKCLEKEPARRYASARALVSDLRSFLDGEPIQARPASLGYRLGKKAHKHRVGVAVAVAFLVIAAAGFLYVRWRSDLRLHYEQRFAQIGQDVDWSLRAVHMSAKHDIRPSKTRVAERIAHLESELEDLASIGRPPAHVAIGQAYAALGEIKTALDRLERVVERGFRHVDWLRADPTL